MSNGSVHKVYIITGSSSGIGAACAKRLAAPGVGIAINFNRSEAEAKKTLAEVESQGAEGVLVRADVSVDADCRKLAGAALERWQRIDGLVNNAGTTKFVAHADLDGLEAEDFVQIYKVNVVGAFQMIRAVTPTMKKLGKGAIVNISSVAGAIGVGSSVAYAASKGALNTMTLSFARALGPEIRVNAILPGFVTTRWLQSGLNQSYDEAKAAHEQSSPLKSVVSAEDVAEAAEWLLIGASKTTGELLIVDGGVHLVGSPRATTGSDNK